MHADRFIAPDQLAYMRDLRRRRALGESISEHFVLAICHVTGKRIEVELNTADIHFQGQPASLATIRDMTEHKELESQLRATSDFLTAVIDAVPVPLVVKDQEQRYLLVNRAFCQSHGVSEEAVIGNYDPDIWSPEVANFIRLRGEQNLADGTDRTDDSACSFPMGHCTMCGLTPKLPKCPTADRCWLAAVLTLRN